MHADVTTGLLLECARDSARSPSTTYEFAHSASSGVEVATLFGTALMNVANGSMSLVGQNADHSS